MLTSGGATRNKPFGASHNLVVVRAGDTSLHPFWMEGTEPRQWDLVISYFGDSPTRFSSDSIRIDSKGPKWPVLNRFVADYWQVFQNYEYICFPDDDLFWSLEKINRFFSLCKQYALNLAQPSLTPDSFATHPITLHNDRFMIRFTNFVEVMAPCFSIEALDRCRGTFGENQSGWGIDWLWPRLLNPHGRLGIVDAVQMTHTRPLGGPNYTSLRKTGVHPLHELQALLKRHNIGSIRARTLGAIELGEHYTEPVMGMTKNDLQKWLTCTW